MNDEKKTRGVLLRSGISRDILLHEFISGMTMVEIARKYNRSGARVWQIIQSGCDKTQFQQYQEQHRENRKALKLEAFLSYAEELERIPCCSEVKALIKGIQTYYNEFKSIAGQHGFIYSTQHIRRGRVRRHSDKQLINHLKKLAAKLGYTPSCSDINKAGKYTHNMYITGFGSVQKAQELAGLSPNKKYNSLENARRTQQYITREHCIEDIMRIRTKLGGSLTMDELRKHGKYSFSKYYSRLGGIKKIRTLPELQQT